MRKTKKARKKPIDNVGEKQSQGKIGFLKRVKSRYAEAGLSWRKEIAQAALTSVIVVLASVLAGAYYESPYIIIGGAVLALVSLFVSYDKPARIISKKKARLRNEFVGLFSFFRLFISNGRSVYASFEESRRYASAEMQPLLERLLREIDADKSVTPYLDFAAAFDSAAIRQTMVSIYDLSLEGGPERLSHFEAIFARLKAERSDANFNGYMKRLGNLNLLPLFSGAFSMVLVALAVMSIMGSVGYGL